MSTPRAYRRCILIAATAALIAAPSLPAQVLAHPGWAGSGITADQWWKNAVFYQLDPLSFQDSNGDGFGDFNGIATRLDYLQALGVDGIILSPLQPRANDKPTAAMAAGAPLFDRTYGSEEDFDNLVQQASSRRIRILVDLPLSGAQTTDSLTGVARFWFSRGVAGLRLVRAANDITSGVSPLTPYQIGDRVRELRKVAAGYAGQRILLGDLASETVAAPIDGSAVPAAPITAPTPTSPATQLANQPQLEIDQHISLLPAIRASDVRTALSILAQPLKTPAPITVYESDTNNRQRSMDRYGDGKHDLGIAGVLATILLANRSAALLYFGQEIGMVTSPAVPKDPTGLGFGRGGDPVPMQWGTPAFTTGTPWLPLAANASTVNVQAEEASPRSLLNWYRQLSALHHGNPTIRDGATMILQTANPDVVVWVRKPTQPTAPPVVIMCNVSNHTVKFGVAAELKAAQLHGYYFHTLLRSDLDALISGPASVESMSLPAYGVYIGELRK